MGQIGRVGQVGRVGSALSLFVALAATLLAQDAAVGRVRAWRAQHEPQILRELFDLLAIPNVASNAVDIERNAQALTRMFEKRRFLPETIPTGGAPLVVAERRVPDAHRTVTFYFHYDGQPVDAREWTHAPPFSPVIVADLASGGRAMKLDEVRGAIDPEWRVFGRSSSDDKSPIVAFLALSMVNFDNNQHGPNENLRIKNLWEGIDSMAALLTMR